MVNVRAPSLRIISLLIFLGLIAVNVPVLALAGQWSVNGSTIYYNDGNLGIGTSTPLTRLDVVGDVRFGRVGGSKLIVQTPLSDVRLYTEGKNLTLPVGNLGVGTTTPSAKIEASQSSGDWLRFNSLADGSQYRFHLPSSGERLEIGVFDGTVNKMHWSVMKFIRNGDIHMGANDDPVMLNVNGAIKTKQVLVTNTGWADYVFEDNYHLRSISELESYINVNKHLPGVMSTKEIEEKGLSLGDMQKVQMEKIEELHLYIIQLEKKINILEDKLVNQSQL